MIETNMPAAELLFGPDDSSPISTDQDSIKPWAQALESLAVAPKYLSATACPNGRPHVIPVLAVWAGESLYVSTRLTSRKGKNLAHDGQRHWYARGCARTGYGVDPLPFFSEQARPHPVATFLQGVSLTGAWREIPTKHYVAAAWPDESPMALSTQRAEVDPGVTVHHWDMRHNVLADGPDRVLTLLRSIPNYSASSRQHDSQPD